jgi:phosphoribosylglycinamide formyltransferase-1
MMEERLRVGVLASGRGTDLQSIIDSSEEGKINAEVVLVCSNRANAQCLERAKKHKSSAYFINPANPAYEKEIDKLMLKHKVGLIVGAGWMRIISPWFIQRWWGKLINIHPALLPSFKGIRAQRDALERGVKISGCTTHFMSEEVDQGPIILQAAVLVKEGASEEVLAKRILEVEHQILPRTVDLFQKHKLRLIGKKVKILPDKSWKELYPTFSRVLYSEGY